MKVRTALTVEVQDEAGAEWMRNSFPMALQVARPYGQPWIFVLDDQTDVQEFFNAYAEELRPEENGKGAFDILKWWLGEALRIGTDGTEYTASGMAYHALQELRKVHL